MEIFRLSADYIKYSLIDCNNNEVDVSCICEDKELIKKIEEWNNKYYNEPNPLKKAQGARVEIEMENGEKIIDELEFANAHPSGKTPFKRQNYIKKMKSLIEGLVSTREEENFLHKIENLKQLQQEDIKQLNLTCEESNINFDKNKIEGIF